MAPDEAERAVALGFLRPEKYGHMERERRWLCERLPETLVPTRVYDIIDRYIDGSHMRLRWMRGHGVPDERKLTKKADLAADTRIITTIYLDADEFALLQALPARIVHKRCHYHEGAPEIAVDVFGGIHAGLVMAEVEFADADLMRDYTPPAWVGREVTQDNAYGGGTLAGATS